VSLSSEGRGDSQKDVVVEVELQLLVAIIDQQLLEAGERRDKQDIETRRGTQEPNLFNSKASNPKMSRIAMKMSDLFPWGQRSRREGEGRVRPNM
jgi:hypothetical protein